MSKRAMVRALGIGAASVGLVVATQAGAGAATVQPDGPGYGGYNPSNGNIWAQNDADDGYSVRTRVWSGGSVIAYVTDYTVDGQRSNLYAGLTPGRGYNLQACLYRDDQGVVRCSAKVAFTA